MVTVMFLIKQKDPHMKKKITVPASVIFVIFFIASQTGCKINPPPPAATLSSIIVDPVNPGHFSDTLGKLVLLIGDSPQNLPQKLTIPEMRTYFEDCRAKGINLCWGCIDGQRIWAQGHKLNISANSSEAVHGGTSHQTGRVNSLPLQRWKEGLTRQMTITQLQLSIQCRESLE
jgi:hypothetical protein